MVFKSVASTRAPRLALLTATILLAIGAGAIAASEHEQVLVSFGADQFPEGLTVAPDGTIYVGIANTAEIVEVAPTGERRSLAQIPVPEGGILLGLAAHGGSVYALVSAGPESGIYAVGLNSGNVALVSELPDEVFPNALLFGPTGAIFVTDTIGGRVLRVQPFGSVETWASDPLLLGNVDDPGPLGMPIGANGIAMAPGGDALYVTVSEGARVVRIAIDDDGGAGEVSIVAEEPALAGADGIAVGADGTIYVAAFVPNHIVAIDPDSGEVDVVASGENYRFPATVRFSPDFETLYVTNFEGFVLFGLQPGPAEPSLLAVDVSALASEPPPAGITPPSTGSAGLVEAAPTRTSDPAIGFGLVALGLAVLGLAAWSHARTNMLV